MSAFKYIANVCNENEIKKNIAGKCLIYYNKHYGNKIHYKY